MLIQRRWPTRLAAALISLTLVGCAQSGDTTTPAVTKEPLPTPIVIIVTATPTPTLPPDELPDTPTPVIIVVTATPSPTAAPLPTATDVPSPTPILVPAPTQTTPTPGATTTVVPTPTPTETAVAIPTPTPTPEATAIPPPTPTSTAATTAAPTPTAVVTLSHVVIQTVDLREEVVTIANLGGAPQSMTGWTLVSEAGGQSFRFPDGFTLAPGATVLVTSGPNGHLAPPAVLQWLKSDGTPSKAYIWNNDGDTAVLRDAAGNTVSRFP